jgi:competence protein ComFC
MAFSERLCPICGKTAVSFLRPCAECSQNIQKGSFAVCSLCAVDLAGSDNPCPDCRSEQTVLDGLTAIGSWRGPLRVWLSELKYGGDSRMADWLAEQLTFVWSEKWSHIPIVPVPPRLSRIFSNVIDPVGLIVKGMERRGVPIERLLVRRGNRTQKSLNRRDRKMAVNLDYRIKRNATINARSYILFDDVTTTGTTLTVCAQLLKSAGAEQVHGFVVGKDC